MDVENARGQFSAAVDKLMENLHSNTGINFWYQPQVEVSEERKDRYEYYLTVGVKGAECGTLASTKIRCDGNPAFVAEHLLSKILKHAAGMR